MALDRIQSRMSKKEELSSEVQSGAQTLIGRGQQARRDGRLSEAKAAFTQAVFEIRDSGDSPASESDKELGQALSCLARVERMLGEIPASLQHYQEAAAVYRSAKPGSGQSLKLAHTVRHIADLLRVNGDPAPAATNYDEALLIYRDHPETEPLDLANTLRGYALLKGGGGHPEAAIAYFCEARTLYERAAAQTGLDMQPAYDEMDREIARLTSREKNLAAASVVDTTPGPSSTPPESTRS